MVSPSKLFALAALFEKATSGELREMQSGTKIEAIYWSLTVEERLMIVHILRREAQASWSQRPSVTGGMVA